MTTIYVSLDALTVPSEKPDAYLGAGISPYTNGFLHWAATKGKVVLLTDRPIAQVLALLDRHGCSKLGVQIRTFTSSKTEVLRPTEDFYLVDEVLIPSEYSWFAEHGLGDRLIPVGSDGVTPATKDKLAARLKH